MDKHKSTTINRAQFMDYFRSDKACEELTADDCRELFLQSLKGQSDLSKNLLDELCADYDTTLEAVLTN